MEALDQNGNAETVYKVFKGKMAGGPTKVDWYEALGKRKQEDERSIEGTAQRIDFYNKNADVYAADHIALGYTGPPKAAEIVYQYYQDHLDACILDVGCGDGLLMEHLSKLGTFQNMHGLDPSTGLLERAEKTGHYSKLIEKYFTPQTGLKADTYDGLVCCGAFIPGHLRAECVKEMCNLVKPGGYVIIVMREVLIHVDDDLKQLRPIMQSMVAEGKVVILEDYAYANYFANFDGQVFVLKKN